MIKLIFWGTPQFAVPSLKCFLAHPEFEVLGVVTQPDKRRGRGNQMMPSQIKQVALDHHLPIWQPPRVKKDAQTLTELRSLQADVFVVVAYGQILSQEILDMPHLGCINGHGSLLPQYRGAAPIQWSICNGEPKTGITTMLMDAGMDTGAMLVERSLPIPLLANTIEISEKLADLTADVLVETLQHLASGTLQPKPQDDEQATYAPLLQKADFVIDWGKSAIALHNQVRAFVPNGVAQFRNQALKILTTVPLTPQLQMSLPPEFQALVETITNLEIQTAEPGQVVYLAKPYGPVVQTTEGWLLLQSIQLAGKKVQSGWDFVNGLRLQVGDILR